MSTIEKPTGAAFAAPKSRKRGLLALGLAGALAATGIGATYASLTVETVREGSSLTAELRGGVPFDEGSGVIVKNISPGEQIQEFKVSGTNVGNVAGHVILSVSDFDTSSLPDGFLDNTMVRLVSSEVNYPGNPLVSLRDFVTKGFGAPLVQPGAKVNYSVVILPANSAEGFTADDLGQFDDVTFNLKFTFSGVGANGKSDLSEYLAAHGERIETIEGPLFALPNGEIKKASENGVTVENVGD